MGVKGDNFKTAGTDGTVTKPDNTVDIAPKRDPRDDVRLSSTPALCCMGRAGVIR